MAFGANQACRPDNMRAEGPGVPPAKAGHPRSGSALVVGSPPRDNSPLHYHLPLGPTGQQFPCLSRSHASGCTSPSAPRDAARIFRTKKSARKCSACNATTPRRSAARRRARAVGSTTCTSSGRREMLQVAKVFVAAGGLLQFVQPAQGNKSRVVQLDAVRSQHECCAGAGCAPSTAGSLRATRPAVARPVSATRRNAPTARAASNGPCFAMGDDLQP